MKGRGLVEPIQSLSGAPSPHTVSPVRSTRPWKLWRRASRGDFRGELEETGGAFEG